MARCVKITTTTGTVAAALLAGGSASVFYGVSAYSAEAASYYIKIYWEGTGTAPVNISGEGQTTTLPVAATTVPQFTIIVPTTGLNSIHDVPINNGGRIWYWISAVAADGTTQTALTTGGDLVTFVFD